MNDISGHWAEASITRMVGQKIISGYPDGSFKPEAKISRAEFATLVVKGFNLPAGSGKVFSDTAGHWAQAAIATAYANNIISGYSDTMFGPDDPITREQMAVMIVKAAKLSGATNGKTFADNSAISTWAQEAVKIAVANNIITGYPDNTFRPQGNATRAEASVVLDKTLALIKTEPEVTDYSNLDKTGTYGPASGTETVKGNVNVKAPGVTLRNLIIEGDLIIAKEVGDGDVTLNNITVKGKTYIRGGGQNSIHINGGQYNEVIIEKTATGAVRVVVVDNTGLQVTIAENAAGEEIILEGQFKNVTVKADNVNVTTQANTTIQEFKVQSGLQNVKVELAEGSSVEKMTLDSKATIEGKGTIKEVTGSQVKESSFETAPDKTTIPSSGGGGGGGGGGTPSTPTETVAAVTIATNPADVSGLAYNAGPVTVTLSTATEGATIYYTTDGTEPTTSSTQYTAQFTVSNPGGMNGGTITVKAIGVKSGMNNSAVAQKTIVYNAASTVTVNNATEFRTAIETNSVGTISLGSDITGNVTATRTGTNNFTINFGSHILTGDLSITANSVSSITFNGSAVPALIGNLTVSAANAHVENYITIDGSVIIDDVGGSSWVEHADGNSITLTDPNGATTTIQGNPADIKVEQGANGISITATSPVSITVSDGATVNNIVANAPGTTITNNGTVASVTANAPTNIVNNSGSISVSGTSTVATSGTAASNITSETAKVVTNISSALSITPTDLRIGGTIEATITGVDLADGETIKEVTSANPAIVSVNSVTGLTVTAQAPGRTALTVQVEKDGEITKQGTIFVTVHPALITSASVTMIAPETGATPQTAAEIESATGNADYTVASIIWNEELTAEGKFKPSQIYTATVVLVSKNNKAFQTGAFYPTVTGAESVSETTTSGTSVGNRVVFTVTFPETEALVVLDSTITQDPGKTGGDTATVTVEGKTITFDGEIAYYEKDSTEPGFPPVSGNYVGVKVTAPTGITPGASTTLEISGRDPIVGWNNFKDGDNYFFYYPKVTAEGQEFSFTVKWDGTDATADTFTIKIAGTATLESAPVPVVSGSIARDPANTGGEDLTVNIDGNTVTFIDGQIKWYPEDEALGRAAGNRVGVQINAPADFDTSEVKVTIGETTYEWDIIEDGDD
ncbi:MAG TPA: hypothetical protein GXX38_00070, partial [Clostridia bacterium]|nr:hypothetical protein [Clostridia bacterium]